MRFAVQHILCALWYAATAFGQSTDIRISLPDSAAIANFDAADRERVLFRFRIMRLGSWSYVWDDSVTRHYGPTAQEFVAAFGNDSLGRIGSDSSFALADVDGITMIAIQGLEDRTQYLRAALATRDEEIKDLRTELAEMKTVAERMRATMNQLSLHNVTMYQRLEQLERAAAEQAKGKMSSLR